MNTIYEKTQIEKKAHSISYNSDEYSFFILGAEWMLEQVLDFMQNFKNEQGEHSLYDYIDNVRKAMEE